MRSFHSRSAISALCALFVIQLLSACSGSGSETEAISGSDGNVSEELNVCPFDIPTSNKDFDTYFDQYYDVQYESFVRDQGQDPEMDLSQKEGTRQMVLTNQGDFFHSTPEGGQVRLFERLCESIRILRLEEPSFAGQPAMEMMAYSKSPVVLFSAYSSCEYVKRLSKGEAGLTLSDAGPLDAFSTIALSELCPQLSGLLES